ncbi:MAG: hypothetical protein OER04_02715 [Cyclobacteriaceae bacterium]|nr:hypothetical protein [Cyclobacteriaceae bacterium]
MHKPLIVILLLISTSFNDCKAQSPTITFASSYYKTTAGAIGPTGIISTTTYDLKLNSPKTIMLDHAVISGLRLLGDGIIIPTNKEGTIEFRVRITTHQKDTVWYNGEIEFQGIVVPANVLKILRTDQIKDAPAMVLYLRSAGLNHIVIKEKFDQEQSQYNK